MELSARALWSRIERARLLDVVEPTGRLEVFLPHPQLHVTRATGHLSHVMALRWIEVIEPAFDKSSPLSNHHQWLDVGTYDSKARRAVTSWAIRRASSCTDIQFVCRSKLVTMAIATVNLATALSGLTMTATTSDAVFNGRLADALLSHGVSKTSTAT